MIFAAEPSSTGCADALLGQDLGRAHDLDRLALGKDDPPRIELGLVEDAVHDLAGPRQAVLELADVLLFRSVGFAGDAGVDGSLGHRRRFPQQDAVVEGFGDQILAAEADRLAAVGADHRVGHVLLGEVGERLGGGELHLLVDPGGRHVEGAAEDERETEHVVDLVRIVRPAGRHDDVGADREGVLREDLGVGVGHREDDRVLRHRRDHFLGHHSLDRNAGEDIGALHGVGQGPRLGVDREALLVGVHARGAALVDHPLGVDHEEVFRLDAERDVEVRAGDAGGTGAGKDDLDLVDLLVRDLEGVDQGRAGDDRGPVLVVVKDRDVAALLERLLDLEALRRADVLEVDAAEGGREQLAEADDLLGVLGVDLDVEHVDVGKALEEDALALHHRFAGHRADVAETEDRGAVGDHGHQVSLVGVLVDQFGVAGDLEAGLGDAGSVGQRQVALGEARFGCHHLGLAVAFARVVGESFFAGDLFHGSSPLPSM